MGKGYGEGRKVWEEGWGKGMREGGLRGGRCGKMWRGEEVMGDKGECVVCKEGECGICSVEDHQATIKPLM